MTNKKEIAKKSDAERIEALESELAKIKARNKRGSVAGLVGAVVGAGGAEYVLSGYVKETADAIEQVYHSAKVASQIVRSLSHGDKALVQEHVQAISPSVRDVYKDYFGKETALTNASEVFVETVEAMQRSSEKFPGANSKPITGLRDTKGKIIETTKGWFKSEERKEEIAQTNTPQYSQNYNSLAEIRLSAIEQRELAKREMNSLATKLESTRLNTGKVDSAGLKALEDLASKYNESSKVLEDIAHLKVGDVYQGPKNSNYQSAVQEARDYGIIPYQPGALADAGFIALGLAGAYAGHKIGRAAGRISHKVADTGRGVYKIGELGVTGAYKAGSAIYSGVNYIGRKTIEGLETVSNSSFVNRLKENAKAIAKRLNTNRIKK